LELKLIKRLVISTTIVAVVLVVYSKLMCVRELSLDVRSAALSTAILLTGWLISAIRLKYLFRVAKRDLSCSIKTCIGARFAGDVLAKITPSSIGGEPARAYYISMDTGLPFLEVYALTIYEVYFDVMFTCISGALFSLWSLPLSLPALITSLVVGATWAAVFNNIGRIYAFIGEKAMGNRLLERSLNRLRASKYFSRFLNKLLDFKDHYVKISSKVRSRQKFALWALTIVIHFTWSLSIIPLVLARHDHGLNMPAIIWVAVAAYCLMQSMSILPTPGGSGVAEYGLSIALPPDVVVAYRSLYFFVPILVGLPFYFTQLGKRSEEFARSVSRTR